VGHHHQVADPLGGLGDLLHYGRPTSEKKKAAAADSAAAATSEAVAAAVLLSDDEKEAGKVRGCVRTSACTGAALHGSCRVAAW
jgi:hypothetical protein